VDFAVSKWDWLGIPAAKAGAQIWADCLMDVAWCLWIGNVLPHPLRKLNELLILQNADEV
jgi:hypothetical protein